jgi:N-carbamoyl-L-amino-acid hydrolase
MRINARRFESVLRELALIGADQRGGLSRLGLSAEESRARDFLSKLSARTGLVPRTDTAGNLLIRRAGADLDRPALLFGSHIDTVRQGGWLDGAYGVVAALEVLTVLVENAVECRYEPVVVAFANEEGALVQYPFWGSRAIAGSLAGALDACDRDGNPVSSYLLAAGGAPGRLAEAAWPSESVAAFLELHIEQGTVLERCEIPIGVVGSITGRTIFEVTLTGESGHAGTTAMRDRKDALTAAARLIVEIEGVAAVHGACATSTVGYLDVTPNVTNTIPGSVRLSAEIRDTDAGRLRGAARLIESVAARLSRTSAVAIGLEVAHMSPPVVTDPGLQAAVQLAASSVGARCRTMASRAGHDAQIMAAICPVGMIFVPSERGISHAPAENTDVRFLVGGADVLLNTVAAIERGSAWLGADPRARQTVQL